MKVSSILAVAVGACTTSAAPAVQGRQLQDGIASKFGAPVDANAVDFVKGQLAKISNAVNEPNRDAALNSMKMLVPAVKPTNVDQASKIMAAVAKENPNLVQYTSHMMANGIMSGSVADLMADKDNSGSGPGGYDNSNPDPPTSVYPKSTCDAPYSVPEAKLRSAIYIPETFTHGQKQPVVLMPGTGNTGYVTFNGSFIPLLSDVDWADPVWVNAPGDLVEDVQVNSEYAAYALNYIASLTGRSVAIIGWSQGNLNAQWAFKYWPSTRAVTTNHIAISADYKGTTMFDLIAPLRLINTPGTIQQGSNSQFIKTLRSNGGDSAYVPTTSLYSSNFDIIVQPQSGTNASAYMLDARKVGVTNVDVQEVCANQPGGSSYGHEGMLYNPIAFALAKDAITNGGPGSLSRINLKSVCGSYLAQGLDFNDLLVTENALLTAAATLIKYMPKATTEPAIKSYATGTASC